MIIIMIIVISQLLTNKIIICLKILIILFIYVYIITLLRNFVEIEDKDNLLTISNNNFFEFRESLNYENFIKKIKFYKKTFVILMSIIIFSFLLTIFIYISIKF